MKQGKMTREEILQKLDDTDARIHELEALHQRLQESEERYRNFIDSINESCYETDLEGRFTFANARLLRETGLSREEILGRPFSAMVLPEEAKKVNRAYRKAFRTGTPVINLLYKYLTKKGDVRVAENTGYIIKDADGNPVGYRGILRDVTDREQKIKDLERYKDFVENVEEACFEVDLRGRYQNFNEALCRLTERDREEMFQADHREFLTPEMSQKIYKMYNEVYRTGKPAPLLEYDLVTKKGEIRHVNASVSLIRDEDGKPVGFQGITRDVTERRNREAELDRYKNFVDNIDDACSEYDLAGRFTFFNDAFCRLSGYSGKEIEQINWRGLAKPESIKWIFETHNKINETGENLHGFVHEIIRKDGTSLYIEVALHVIKNDKGEPVGFRSISRDITEKKKKEEDLEKYRVFFENIEDSIFELDLRGRFTLFNQATCRNLEYSAEELKTLSYRDRAATPEIADKGFKLYVDVYRNGNPTKVYGYKTVTKSGRVIYYDISISLVRDAAGNPMGFRCVSRDITDRKRLEEEQEQLKE
ncbi:MAG: PAS domain-containing protein, partial [Deltaproteobacteria bacterium]|nr:PAS domain-containing protein [Deltaproteobacteria bacterium]